MADHEASSGSRRGRTGTLIPLAEPPVAPDEEHLNIPSQRRRDLLVELGRALGTNEVPLSFWACLQVCDIERLEYIVRNAKDSPLFVSCFSYTCHSMIRAWVQRPEWDRREAASTTTSSPSRASDDQGTPPKRRRVRESAPKNLARERDHGSCVLTGLGPSEVAHIYPNCLIHPSVTSRSDPGFWRLLSAFWPPEKIEAWQSKIFRDPVDPSKPLDACFNLITLLSTLHKMWGKGLFALRPLDYNADMTELEVEFYWQPHQDHKPADLVPLTKIPLSSRDLDFVVADGIRYEHTPRDGASYKSGQKFVLRTEDPERLPLPSKELLDLQWNLNRIVAMAAAGEKDDEEEFSEDDDDGDLKRWIESSVPQPSFAPHPASAPPPGSPSAPSSPTDGSGSEHDISFSTTSTGPSPVKTREAAIESQYEESSPLVLQ